jgi:TonB family protein
MFFIIHGLVKLDKRGLLVHPGCAPVATNYSKLIYGFVVERQVFPTIVFFGKAHSNKSIRDRIRHILTFGEVAMKKKTFLLILLPAVLSLLIVLFSWQCAGKSNPMASEPSPELAKKTNIPADADVQTLLVKYDTPPWPIGGFRAIQENIVFPEAAKAAGVNGRVIVQVLVDEEGNVPMTRIMKVDSALIGTGCEEAAIDAVERTGWEPANQGDMPVKVWVAVPVIFRTKSTPSVLSEEDRL